MRIVSNLRLAHRCAPQPLPKPKSEHARNGLRYERNVVKALSACAPIHNPWYYFEDDNGPGYICPDILFPIDAFTVVVVECKLTYKAEAIHKLNNLYCPILAAIELTPVYPLVIVKNVTENAPEPSLSISAALKSKLPLLQWLGKGAISWA